MLRIESRSLPQRSATATHSGLLGSVGLDQLPNQRVFSASGVSDKTVGLAMCYHLANRFARCYWEVSIEHLASKPWADFRSAANRRLGLTKIRGRRGRSSPGHQPGAIRCSDLARARGPRRVSDGK